jgi:hypothetical protein
MRNRKNLPNRAALNISMHLEWLRRDFPIAQINEEKKQRDSESWATELTHLVENNK